MNIIAIFIIEIHPLLYYHLNLCGTSSLFCKFERERKKIIIVVQFKMMLKNIIMIILLIIGCCHGDKDNNIQFGYINSNVPSKQNAVEYQLVSTTFDNIPRSIDYRDKYVTPVKNQGKCGSCWAFSTIEEIESQVAFKTGKVPPPLSVEQVLVCCGDNITTCAGCMGGDTVVAYEYLMSRSKGLDLDGDYPYDDRTDPFDPPKCKASEYKPVVQVKSWSYAVKRGSDTWNVQKEQKLAAVLVEHGPISIAMDMTIDMLHKYNGGISTGMGCKSDSASLDHAVQLVGYDLDQGYWIVRNSYGPEWGEKGYMRLTFGNNTCGVTNEATLVEVETL